LAVEIAAAIVVAIAREATSHWIAHGAVGDFTDLANQAFDTADTLFAESLIAATALRRRNTP
jgi:hypothetical protein